MSLLSDSHFVANGEPLAVNLRAARRRVGGTSDPWRAHVDEASIDIPDLALPLFFFFKSQPNFSDSNRNLGISPQTFRIPTHTFFICISNPNQARSPPTHTLRPSQSISNVKHDTSNPNQDHGCSSSTTACSCLCLVLNSADCSRRDRDSICLSKSSCRIHLL